MSRNVLLFIAFFVGCIGIGVIWEIMKTRCPSCKKLFARVIDKSQSGFHTDVKRGDFITRKTTVSHCKCKFCGYEWEQQYTTRKR